MKSAAECRYAKRYTFEGEVWVAWPYKGKRFKMKLNCGVHEETFFMIQGNLFVAVMTARHLDFAEIQVFNQSRAIEEDSIRLEGNEVAIACGREWKHNSMLSIGHGLFSAWENLVLI